MIRSSQIIICKFKVALEHSVTLVIYYINYDITCLGNIPLRHLVYRVLDLPLSMQPLLYDFGQVVGTTEDEYIHQIVVNYVCLLVDICS